MRRLDRPTPLRLTSLLAAALLTAGATAANAQASAPRYADEQSGLDDRSSYSYVRSIEGRATLAAIGQGPGDEADLNQILQQGDRLTVERGARLEVALSDRNLIRLGSGADLRLTQIAFSADSAEAPESAASATRSAREARTTRLDFERGELVLSVTDEALGDELPEIRTASGSVVVHQPGIYRVRAEDDGYLELVVRSGYAELVTERGSTVVRAGEEAWTSNDRWRSVEVGAAGPRTALERWGDQLDQQAEAARDRLSYVEPELAYAAAPLADHGSWVNVDASWYWRPRVAAGWRPYWDGRWVGSPSGMTWVSNEPWGWVPYHYGTWCQVANYGWVWRPGRVYSPAWVYWYVSNDWSGWCPIGYYTNYYRSGWNTGFRFGIYGWAGGDWGLYSDWNFAPSGRICDRRGRNYWQTGGHVGRDAGGRGPHGVVTTDTRPLPRDRWDRPGEVVELLERTHRGRNARGGQIELPVVTDFVARKRDLPPAVERAITPEPGFNGRRRGTPLDPDSVRAEQGEPQGRIGVNREQPQAGWRQRDDVANGRGSAAGDANAAENGRVTRERYDRPASGLAPAVPNSIPGQPAVQGRQGWRTAGPDRPQGAPQGTGNNDAPEGAESFRQRPGDAAGYRVGEVESQRPQSEPQRDRFRARDLGPAPDSSAPAPAAPPAARGQAWRERSGAPDRAAPPAGQNPYASPPPRPNGNQPVERVIGGLRRSAPQSYPQAQPGARSAGTPRPSPTARPAPAPGSSGSGVSAGSRFTRPATPAARPPSGTTQRVAPPPRASSNPGTQPTPPPRASDSESNKPPRSSSKSRPGSGSNHD